MVLAITDSCELAIVYAANIGGIMVGKLSVQAKNLDDKMPELVEKMLKDGYISTFFRGEQYVFICAGREAFSPSKLVDYCANYQDVTQRPVPFIPNPFTYRCCDKKIEEHAALYLSMIKETAYIINATTDSIGGTLSFIRFISYFKINKTVMRVRPRMLTNEKILETFNSPEDGKSCAGYAEASKLQEELDWLVMCNASNALAQRTKGRMTFAAGRIEMLLLCRANDVLSSSGYRVKILTSLLAGTQTEAYAAGGFPSRDQADKAAMSIRKSGKAQILRAELKEAATAAHVIHNCFSVAVEAGKRFAMPPQTVSEALWRLFLGGYISWPSRASSVPWSAKQGITAAVSLLLRRGYQFEGINPREIERYAGWDDEPPTGKTGLFISDRSTDCLSGAELQVYDLIAEGVCREMRERKRVYRAMLFCETAGYKIPIAAELPTETPQLGSGEGDTIPVIDVIVEPPHPYRSYQLLRDVQPLFHDAFADDFRFFDKPMNHLVDWGLVTMDSEQGITITDRGLQLLRQLDGTPLTDLLSITGWDRRLLRVALGEEPAQNVRKDMPAYIETLVRCIDEAFDVMTATGGIGISECRCPRCSSPVVWESDLPGWKCCQDACQFQIPSEYHGHILTARDMAMLLSSGETEMAFDFQSSKGRQFPARILLSPAGQLSLSFQSKCLCPKCGNHYLSEFSWGLACPDKKGCGYTVGTQKCGVRLTEAEEIAIFRGEKTPVIHKFKSSEGKAFSASLYLDSDLKIKFEFPSKNVE